MADQRYRHLSESALHGYLDGIAGPGERSQVQRHLSDCRECGERVETLRRLFSTLETVSEAPMSRDLTPAVVAALRARQRAWKRLRLAAAAQTAGAVVVGALTWWLAGPEIVRLVAETLPSLGAPLSQTLLGQMADSWEGVLAATASWLEHATWLAGLPLEDMPAFPRWGALLTAAGLLWLAANGVTLRRMTAERRRGGAPRVGP